MSSPTYTIHLRGSLDIETADTLVEEVQAAAQHHETIRLDLSELGFLDSTGVGALVRLHQELQQQGRQLQLYGVSPDIRELLGLLGVLSILNVS